MDVSGILFSSCLLSKSIHDFFHVIGIGIGIGIGIVGNVLQNAQSTIGVEFFNFPQFLV